MAALMQIRRLLALAATLLIIDQVCVHARAQAGAATGAGMASASKLSVAPRGSGGSTADHGYAAAAEANALLQPTARRHRRARSARHARSAASNPLVPNSTHARSRRVGLRSHRGGGSSQFDSPEFSSAPAPPAALSDGLVGDTAPIKPPPISVTGRLGTTVEHSAQAASATSGQAHSLDGGVRSGSRRAIGRTGVPTATALRTVRASKIAARSNAGGGGKPRDLDLPQAKPDLLAGPGPSSSHTIDNPMQAVGDGWKMVAYLLPTLIFVLVCLNVLRRFQQKNGRLPTVVQKAVRAAAGPRSSIVGSLATLLRGSHDGSRTGTTSGGIRLIESLTIGTAMLHLVKVRGRTLLLSGAAAGVTVLAEFADQENAESDEFRQMLHAASANLDELELGDSEMPVSAIVGSLEEVMRETGSAMERRLRRLRTVQETEDGPA